MALTYDDSEKGIPIAKVVNQKKIIYLVDTDDYNVVPEKSIVSADYVCPYCKHKFSSKASLLKHLKNACKQKGSVVMKTYPSIELKTGMLRKLPVDDHEVIFVTGPPKCGKSHWVNEYVKAYIQMFKRDVHLFTRLEQDDTLNAEMYNRIPITNELPENPFKLEDFANSLVIFDDIESSEFKKGTEYVYNLLDDMILNGRHHNINVIFCNQMCRLGKKTRRVLACLTMLVIYPSSGETYQSEHLLKEYCGFSKSQINEIFNIKSRWVAYSRPKPQYIMYERGIYMMGKKCY